jgi:dTDP-4-dehydrorhamnose reductase
VKILITGAKGQLGNKLIEVLRNDNELVLTDSDTMDITDASATSEKITFEKPDLIIHTAAYTKVDQAETDRDLAYNINATGTKNVSLAAKKNNATLIYISTDYVFDGTATSPYKEEDTTSPVNYYGETKLAGEKFVQETCDRYYILRTAWLYGELPQGHPGSNFVETMLRLAKDRDGLNVVNDQTGSPTYTGDLVNVICQIIERQSGVPFPYGLYHVSGKGETTWYKFAKKIFELTHTDIKLNPITTNKYPTAAKRPRYSYLSKDKIEKENIIIRPWEDGLYEYLTKR